MGRQGKMPVSSTGFIGPFLSPPLDITADLVFANSHILLFNYESDPEAIAAVVPEIFNVPDDAKVNAGFYNYGVTRNGGYREFMLFVSVEFEGKRYSYSPSMYVTNEVSLISGRELMGAPKLLADIRFDPLEPTNESVFSARLSRPADVPLAFAAVRPRAYLADLSTPGAMAKVSSMRDPSIAVRNSVATTSCPDLVISHSEFTKGDVWACDGELSWTGLSAVDPLHRLPVRRALSTYLLTSATMRIVPESRVVRPLQRQA